METVSLRILVAATELIDDSVRIDVLCKRHVEKIFGRVDGSAGKDYSKVIKEILRVVQLR